MNEAGEQFATEKQSEQSGSSVESAPATAETNSAAETVERVDRSLPAPRVSTEQGRAVRLPKQAEHYGWTGAFQSLLTTVVIAVFAITFVVQAFQIPSESMQNTLLIGDYLLVDKAHYGPAGMWSWLLPYQKIKRGDIIVFRYPVDPKQHFVKRVIGTPGDRVRLVNGRVFINGEPVAEPFVIHSKGNFEPFRDNFPNGDPRWEQIDPRWGQQMRSFTENRELIVPDGNYFVMGDNRDDSLDSRYWGFVPRENVVGRPLVIYWSMRKDDPYDTPDVKPEPGGKLTRLTAALRQSWQDMRWSRMLTLVH